jgi:amino acid transporter
MHRRGPWSKKPLHLVLEDDEQATNAQQNRRHLNLFDLISIGVGGTVGSGIFVLAGMIARDYAGPSTCISFLMSGLAALCSGVCYAEWAGRLPAAGSTYVYALVTLGEWPAVIAGACLTLEYGVSGAAVARSWADKVLEWYSGNDDRGDETWSPLAGLISLLTVFLLSMGVKESKGITNIFTVLKIGLVIFMMVGGFGLFDTSNLKPWAPHGFSGTLRGATSSFFAFLGYDEVCCFAGESKHPARDMPRAVLWTIGIVTSLYFFAALALTGMVPSEQISGTSGFPAAFSTRGVEWAAQVAAIGEIITLPVVVVISLLAQPRLFCAMAEDGLLPSIFQQRNAEGNLVWSLSLCGIPMAFLATFVPFSWLDDSISVGILLAFNMTNASLIQCKCQDLSMQLVGYHVVAFGSAIVSQVLPGTTILLLCIGTTLGLAISIHMNSTKQLYFGSHLAAAQANDLTHHMHGTDSGVFETPMVPFLPLLGIAMNWYLIAQLELSGLCILFAYLAIVSAWYGLYCSKFTLPWGYENVRDDRQDGIQAMDGPGLLREYSMPKR